MSTSSHPQDQAGRHRPVSLPTHPAAEPAAPDGHSRTTAAHSTDSPEVLGSSSRSRRWLTFGGLAVLFIANTWLLIWFGGSLKSGAKAKYANPPQFASVRAPQPAVSSHPQLKLNLPLLVPGLEQVDPAYAPTLTTDLKVLAFAGAGRQTGDYDLFLTRRASPAEPFSTPARIESCASRQYETFPTLSPDGLELLFLRFESRPTLYYARRDSVDAEFGQPVAWPAQNAVPDSRRVGGAQFIDAHHVQFVTRGDTAEQHRSILLTRRPDVGAAFAPPTPLEFTEAPVPQSVSSNLLRSYYGIPNGLFMTARKSVSEPLGVPARILEVPADGPVWVAPQEDVLYFCSPGFGHLIESSRRLWVLRF